MKPEKQINIHFNSRNMLDIEQCLFGTFLFSVHFVENIYKSKSAAVQILWKLVTEGSAASFEEPQDLFRVTIRSMCLTEFSNNNNFFADHMV